jgi:hypothetical protein
MKLCAICCTLNEDATTCLACGEASWADDDSEAAKAPPEPSEPTDDKQDPASTQPDFRSAGRRGRR